MEKKTSIIRATIDLGYNTRNDIEEFLITLYTPTLYERILLARKLSELDYLIIEQCDKIYFYDTDILTGCNSILGCLKENHRLLSYKNQADIDKTLDRYYNKENHLYYYIDVYCPKILKSQFAKDLKRILESVDMTLVDRSVNNTIIEDYLRFFNKSYKTVRES